MPFALPVDGCLAFSAQDGAKMFDVLFVSVFDSEVIDNEGEGDVDGEGDDDSGGDDGGALNYSLCWFKRPRS